MKLMEWITIFQGLEEAGADEDTEMKFFSESGMPYEIKRVNSIPDIQREVIYTKDKETNETKEHLLFKVRIK